MVKLMFTKGNFFDVMFAFLDDSALQNRITIYEKDLLLQEHNSFVGAKSFLQESIPVEEKKTKLQSCFP